MTRSLRNPDREQRFVLLGGHQDDDREAFARDVRQGLAGERKQLSCRFLYDRAGSELFELITELDEYYTTRAEDEILEVRAAEIVGHLELPVELVELGSGSATKTRRLIEALLERQPSLEFDPIDVSESALRESAETLLADHPRLSVRARRMGYLEGLDSLGRLAAGSRLVLWLGSSIGNFSRTEAARFLAHVRRDLGPGDRLLVGVDLAKDPAVLERAYDDSSGVTARFTKNLLARANRELGAHFDLDAFAHRARWDASGGRVVLTLESLVDQEVSIEALELVVRFRRGEAVHVEDSHKYTHSQIDELLAAADLERRALWTDSGARFVDVLAAPRDRHS